MMHPVVWGSFKHACHIWSHESPALSSCCWRPSWIVSCQSPRRQGQLRRAGLWGPEGAAFSVWRLGLRVLFKRLGLGLRLGAGHFCLSRSSPSFAYASHHRAPKSGPGVCTMSKVFSLSCHECFERRPTVQKVLGSLALKTTATNQNEQQP